MRKLNRYLPAVTADGQKISVGVLIDDDAKFRKWLSSLKRREYVDPFRFLWAEYTDETEYDRIGVFHPGYDQDGIYVWIDLLSVRYRGVSYPLDELCSMLFKNSRPSSIGMCITVKV